MCSVLRKVSWQRILKNGVNGFFATRDALQSFLRAARAWHTSWGILSGRTDPFNPLSNPLTATHPTAFLLLLVSLLFAGATPARAASLQAACDEVPPIEWQESTTRSFSIQYPAGYALIAQVLQARQNGEALEREYSRFEAMFETSLALPVTIRIYPDVQTYACLNALSDEPAEGLMHTPTGSREISLIGDNIAAQFPVWMQNDVNLLRYDLAVLFGRQMTGDNAPPGLLAVLGHYAQDPQETIGSLHLQPGDWLEPSYGWRELWEDESAATDLGRSLQATSTLAFLVDRYGWESLLNFLRSLPAAKSYGPALEQAYGLDVGQLEQGWQQYYPHYFQGGWRSHLIYNYDLSRYQDLIRVEKYREADRELQIAIAFLQKTDQGDKVIQAQLLRLMALQGQEAEALFARSQQAFQGGDYLGSLTLLEQARQKYSQTSNRMYHLDEFSAYRQRVVEVLVLHDELDRLQGEVAKSQNTFATARRLIPIGQRLSSLGDRQGYDRVAQLLGLVEQRQRQQHVLLSAAVAVVVVLLLLNLLRVARHAPPPEAEL